MACTMLMIEEVSMLHIVSCQEGIWLLKMKYGHNRLRKDMTMSRRDGM